MKGFLGITKLDLTIMYHFAKHGKFKNPEILAHCPVDNQDHKVMTFTCNCGDIFFCHLNKAEKMFKTGPFKSNSPLFE